MPKPEPIVFDPKIHWIYEHCHFTYTNADGEKLWCEWGSPNKPDWHAMTVIRHKKDGGVD